MLVLVLRREPEREQLGLEPGQALGRHQWELEQLERSSMPGERC